MSGVRLIPLALLVLLAACQWPLPAPSTLQRQDGGGDSTPSDGLQMPKLADGGVLINQSATQVEVRAAGRFRLLFDQAHKWQAAAWYDLSTDPAQNLGGLPEPNVNFQVVQSPVGIRVTSKWYTLEHALAPSFAVLSAGPAVVLDTRWHWQDGSTRIDVRAVHTVHADGQWQVQVTVTPAAPSVVLGQFEYAYTNVAWSLGWVFTSTVNKISVERTSGATPHPLMEILAAAGHPAVPGTDQTGNHFWAAPGGPTITPAAPLQLTYTNRIWR